MFFSKSLLIINPLQAQLVTKAATKAGAVLETAYKEDHSDISCRDFLSSLPGAIQLFC